MTFQPKDRLIFALDVPDKRQALDLVQLLEGEVGLFKLGLELYLAEGPGLLKELVNIIDPERIFLDLKLYDIPATVLGPIRSILHGLALFTLPSDLGPAALKSIVSNTAAAFRVLAVTVLTSTTGDDLKALGYERRYWENPARLVVDRAVMAKEAGCAGVVCSGREVKAVKEACGPDFLAVCPGIRPEWAAVPGDDQKRIVTPYEAIKNGADYIVVGRPIRTYPESQGGPVAAARRVVAEVAAASEP
ncbi:MAG: orotidine-5'-phosphate decarboxylase [Deltaproteobacteria bacterium]|nr:orotidine-5'-phosphate decarboxylase [Deltaproteobacteria bacterium]